MPTFPEIPISLLKMQKERRLCIEKWPFILRFEVLLALCPNLLLVGVARLVGGLSHSQLASSHRLMGNLVKRACRKHRLVDYRAAKRAAEDGAAVTDQWWAVGAAAGCALGASLPVPDLQIDRAVLQTAGVSGVIGFQIDLGEPGVGGVNLLLVG